MTDLDFSLTQDARQLVDSIIDDALIFQENLIRTKSVTMQYIATHLQRIMEFKGRCTDKLYQSLQERIKSLQQAPKFVPLASA